MRSNLLCKDWSAKRFVLRVFVIVTSVEFTIMWRQLSLRDLTGTRPQRHFVRQREIKRQTGWEALLRIFREPNWFWTSAWMVHIVKTVPLNKLFVLTRNDHWSGAKLKKTGEEHLNKRAGSPGSLVFGPLTAIVASRSAASASSRFCCTR